MNRKKLLFLACDLSGYFLACLRALAGGGDVDVDVVHYPGDPDAPFELDAVPGVRFHAVARGDAAALEGAAGALVPDAVICSGWADPGYLRLCRRLKGRCRRVLVSDNPWQGTARQRLAALTGRSWLRRHFDAAWVAGPSQREYLRRLGYADHEISEGCYSCDVPFFRAEGDKAMAARSSALPKRFLYVGRYIAVKGVETLWPAFEAFTAEGASGWELWCAGRGDLRDRMPSLPNVRDVGFVQPRDIGSLVAGGGVFVMPSLDDHWGVAIQEFAAAGFPLVCSRKAMAATAFLREGFNGFYHEAGDAASLARALRQIASLPEAERVRMGKNSMNLAGQITPVIWCSIARQYLSDSLPAFRFDPGGVTEDPG